MTTAHIRKEIYSPLVSAPLSLSCDWCLALLHRFLIFKVTYFVYNLAFKSKPLLYLGISSDRFQYWRKRLWTYWDMVYLCLNVSLRRFSWATLSNNQVLYVAPLHTMRNTVLLERNCEMLGKRSHQRLQKSDQRIIGRISKYPCLISQKG